MHKFYAIFNSLEDQGLLNVLDDLDLFSLHYVYLPIIKRHLEFFREAYMHHKIRTACNKTPVQLWLSGALDGYPVDHLEQVGESFCFFLLFEILHIFVSLLIKSAPITPSVANYMMLTMAFRIVV